MPWLAPSAPALAALATTAEPWNDTIVCHDPGAVALLLRFKKSNNSNVLAITADERVSLIRFAYRQLKARPRGVSSHAHCLRTIRRISELASRFAPDEIAEKVRIVGLMTALG